MVSLPCQMQGWGVCGVVCVKHTNFSKNPVVIWRNRTKPSSNCSLETLWPRTQRLPFQTAKSEGVQQPQMATLRLPAPSWLSYPITSNIKVSQAVVWICLQRVDRDQHHSEKKPNPASSVLRSLRLLKGKPEQPRLEVTSCSM